MNKNMLYLVTALLFLYGELFSAVTLINSKAELMRKIAENKPTVIYFSTSVCGPCKLVGPLYEQLSHDTPNVLFLKLVTDQMADGNSFGLRSVPAFKFAINGSINESLTFTGYSEGVVKRLQKNIDNLLKGSTGPSTAPVEKETSVPAKVVQPSVAQVVTKAPVQSVQIPASQKTIAAPSQPIVTKSLPGKPLAQQPTSYSKPSKPVVQKTITHKPLASPMNQAAPVQPRVQPMKLTPTACPYESSGRMRGSKIRTMRQRRDRRPRQRMITYDR